MTVAFVPDGWVKVELPQWLWGGNALGLLARAEMEHRRTGNDGGLLVRTSESFYRRRPALIEVLLAAGPGAVQSDFESLAEMGDDEIDVEARAAAASVIERRFGDPSGDLLDMAVFSQLATGAVLNAEIPDQAASTLAALRSVTLSESGEGAFSDAGVYAIRRSDVLPFRMKLMAVLLRLAHDDRAAAGDISALQEQSANGSVQTFAASEGLISGMYLLDPFVGTLLGALTPAVWGFAAHRGKGPVIYSMGRQVRGSDPGAPEFLRTLPVFGADRATQFEPMGPEAVPSAVAWWAHALNDMFAVTSDWAVFADANGNYRPMAQLEAAATVEQLFRRVLSIQANHHDLNARRVLLFTVLDTLESLTGRPIEMHCDLEFAKKTLLHLQEVLPGPAAELLLPRARRAVTALRGVQDGFFLVEADGTVVINPSTGRSTTRAKAAAQYMKLLRNATHGHGTVRANQRELAESLLARHSGHMPHDVPLLAWLYLLDFLARPQALRALLVARARKPR